MNQKPESFLEACTRVLARAIAIVGTIVAFLLLLQYVGSEEAQRHLEPTMAYLRIGGLAAVTVVLPLTVHYLVYGRHRSS